MQVPPDHDPSDVTARRVLNRIYAGQRLPEPDVAGLAERFDGERLAQDLAALFREAVEG